MKKDTLKLVSLGSLIAAAPVFAFAGFTVGETVGVNQDEIRAALEADGAEVLEFEIEDGEIEVEYVLDGVEYEAEIDPNTGIVVAQELEDDDDDGDDYEDDHDDDDDDDT